MNERNDNRRDDTALAGRAAELFADSVDSLDGATRSRLNQARRRALQASTSRRLPGRWNSWLPAGAAAVVATVAIVLWGGVEEADVVVAPSLATDFEILMDQEELEMLQELEFYAWMELDAATGTSDGNVS